MTNVLEPADTFTASDISTLKELFKNEINSNRKFEEIYTIEELYNVLEDRDVLTSDVLLTLEPKFQKFVQTQCRKNVPKKELNFPQAVVKLICDNYPNDWETLGTKLKLTKEQISQCKTCEDVLMRFKENCNGVSPQEMVFRLNRALENCGKGCLKSTIVMLMEL